MSNQDSGIQISLNDFVQHHKKNRSKIFIIFPIFLLIALYGIFFYERNYLGTLVIHEIDDFEENKYSNFKEFENIYPISSELLITNLYRELTNKDEIEEQIEKLGLIKRNDFEDSISYNIAKSNFSKNVKISLLPMLEFIGTKNINDPNFSNETISKLTNNAVIEILFEHRSKKVIYEFLKSISNNSNQSLHRKMQKKFDKIIENKSFTINNQISDLKTKRDILKEHFQEEKRIYINFLVGQAGIARSLGIDNSQLMLLSHEINNTSSITSIEKDQPYYFRGFLSIEKDIENLKSTNTIPKIIKELNSNIYEKLINIEMELQVLLEDKTISRLKETYDSSPINTVYFKSGHYSPDNFTLTKVEPLGKMVLIILLVLFLIFLYFSLLITSILIEKSKYTSSS